MKKIAVVLALLMVVGTVPAWAVCGSIDNWIGERAQSDIYGEKLVGLLLDGIHRVVESPYELLYHPYDDIANKGEKVTGLFTGLTKGLFYGVQNIVVGAINIVSAPVPGSHGVSIEHGHTLVS